MPSTTSQKLEEAGQLSFDFVVEDGISRLVPRGERNVLQSEDNKSFDGNIDVPSKTVGFIDYHDITIHFSDLQLRKIDEIATYLHCDSREAIKRIVDDYEVKSRVPKSQTCNDVRSAEKKQSRSQQTGDLDRKIGRMWQTGEIAKRDRGYVQIKGRNFKIFHGPEGLKKTVRWACGKLAEEGIL